eukprot:CCRYP_001792-RA/>CCRYP_001792-RA protein AED:0.08 eAED:0.04 QI:0/0/0/0.66/0.5/0.66/3/0/464
MTVPRRLSDFTATLSEGSKESESPNNAPIPAQRGRRRSSLLKNNLRDSIAIKDLTGEEGVRARKFDLDGDGLLDEAEQAMMRYDIDGDGNLGLEEIHAIVSEHLRAKNNIGALRKVIAGLTCFVVILALSNLGTSLASAILVKETAADQRTSEMRIIGSVDVVGTQSSAETFEALEMDVETRRARRALVVDSLKANPFGEHAHRHLARSADCTGKKCDKDIKFDTNYMTQDDAERMKAKCELGRVVNVKRSFPGGSVDTKSLCRSGSNIVIKQIEYLKKTYMIARKGPRKKQGKAAIRKNGFDMVVISDGKDTTFDCDGKNCYISGSNLRQKHGEPCNLNHGSDDCEAGLVCVQDANDVTSGRCLSDWNNGIWYVDWVNHKCVQDCVGGPNCGGDSSFWEEEFATYQLCCDTHLSYLTGGYKQCVPDLDFYLGKGQDCSNSRTCRNDLVCRKSALNGSDRWYCV